MITSYRNTITYTTPMRDGTRYEQCAIWHTRRQHAQHVDRCVRAEDGGCVVPEVQS